ncbi:MAG: hypothetical protein RR746_00485 [Lachnospiraceae bacterium]
MVNFDSIKTKDIVLNTNYDFAFRVIQKYLPVTYDGYDIAHLTFLKTNEAQDSISGRKVYELYQNYYGMLAQYQNYHSELIVNRNSYIQNLRNILHVYQNQLKQIKFQDLGLLNYRNFYENSYIFRNMHKVSDPYHLSTDRMENPFNSTEYVDLKENHVWDLYNQNFMKAMGKAYRDTSKQTILINTYLKETTYEAQSQLFYLIKTNLKKKKQEDLCRQLEERKYYTFKDNLTFYFKNEMNVPKIKETQRILITKKNQRLDQINHEPVVTMSNQTWKDYIKEHASWSLQKHISTVIQQEARQRAARQREITKLQEVARQQEIIKSQKITNLQEIIKSQKITSLQEMAVQMDNSTQQEFLIPGTIKYDNWPSYPKIKQIFYVKNNNVNIPKIKETQRILITKKNQILDQINHEPVVTMSNQTWKDYIKEHASWSLQKHISTVIQQEARQQEMAVQMNNSTQQEFLIPGTINYVDWTLNHGIKQMLHTKNGMGISKIIKTVIKKHMESNISYPNESEVFLYPQTNSKQFYKKEVSEVAHHHKSNISEVIPPHIKEVMNQVEKRHILEETSTLVKRSRDPKVVREQNNPIVSNDKLTEYFNIPEENLSSKNKEIETQNRKIMEFQTKMEQQIHSVKKDLMNISQKKLEYSQIHVITKEVLKEMEKQLKLERMRRGID